MSVIANTETAPTKMELIIAAAQRELKFQSKMAQFFYDASPFATKGNKSVSFPKLSSFQALDRASGAAGVLQAIASSAEKLDLDKVKQVLWLIDPQDEIQSTLNWELETIRRAAGAHGRQFDRDLIETITAGMALTGGVISRDAVLDMREYLKKNEANMNQVGLFIAPSEEKAMLKITEFTQAQVYGNAVIPSGVIGQVYGVPVVVHNGLEDGEYFMADKDALAYAFQKLPAYDEQKAIEYGAGAMKRTLDQHYGMKLLQIESTTLTPAGKSSLAIGNV
jgi:hypothetical protein